MGKVKINLLHFNAVIGTLPEERIRRQQLIVDLEFDYDAQAAASSDDLNLSVDYSAVEKRVAQLVENSSFALLEALAGAIGREILSFPQVTRTQVTITKPAASAFGGMISFTDEYLRGEV